jgi:hypothetical protein
VELEREGGPHRTVHPGTAIIVFEFVGIKNLRLHDADEERQNLVHAKSIDRTEHGYRFQFAPSRRPAGELPAEQIAVHLERGR